MSTNNNHKKPAKLGQVFATAICGNDILSSVLYTGGVAIVFAGIYAPLILLAIALVLLLYKTVYTEVVEALPINGGAYNCLLNGTSKPIAAMAGVMTILSYIATAVISAKTAMEYLHTIVPVPVIPGTIVLMFLFAILVISGIKDSARVALAFFMTHIITLTIFIGLGVIAIVSGSAHFFGENSRHTALVLTNNHGLINTLFLAFSTSLLGVSGFESSANFVEEQRIGVFRKTLRNMLIAVAVFNPLVSIVLLNVLPYKEILAAKDFILSDAAKILGGPILQYFTVIDAFLVLSGAVLTAFIGVSGLINRMAADGSLPNSFTKQNSKGAFPTIVIAFFFLCSSILLLTKGNLMSLAGVYTISFLGVMTLFAIGNLILRVTRAELKRTYKAPLLFVILAGISTTIGIIGNIKIDPKNLGFFLTYFIPALIIVFIMIYQDYILRFCMYIVSLPYRYIESHFNDVIKNKFIVFIHTPERFHKILEYIHRNEYGREITFVYCKDKKNEAEAKKTFEDLGHVLYCLQKAGAFPHLVTRMVYKTEEFGPKVISHISKEFGIRKNRIMIGSIHDFHKFDYVDLGGVRIIA